MLDLGGGHGGEKVAEEPGLALGPLEQFLVPALDLVVPSVPVGVDDLGDDLLGGRSKLEEVLSAVRGARASPSPASWESSTHRTDFDLV